MYMAIKHLPIIAERLISEGRQGMDSIAIIQDATLKTQKVIESNLKKINDDVKLNNIKSQAIIVLGQVVDLSSKLIQNVIKDVVS